MELFHFGHVVVFQYFLAQLVLLCEMLPFFKVLLKAWLGGSWLTFSFSNEVIHS